MPDAGQPERVQGIAGEELKNLVSRIERLEEEKKALSEDIKDVYGQAKSTGFDVKILRQIIALRKKATHERLEAEEILEIYKSALGME